jgi:hypothetical protein
MEECSGWEMDCLSQTEVDNTDDMTDEVDGNEAAAVDTAGGGEHQTTTEAASHDKADAHLTDDGTNPPPTTDDGIMGPAGGPLPHSRGGRRLDADAELWRSPRPQRSRGRG